MSFAKETCQVPLATFSFIVFDALRPILDVTSLDLELFALEILLRVSSETVNSNPHFLALIAPLDILPFLVF